MGRGVEHHLGVVGLKHLVQPLFVPDGADQHLDGGLAAVFALQLHLQLVGTVLVNIKDQQPGRAEPHHLAAQLAADAAAAPRHQHHLVFQVAADLLGVQGHLVPREEVRGVQLAEGVGRRAGRPHRLGVAQDLHLAVGGHAQVDDVVQPAAPQGGDGNDDAIDVVAGAQLGDVLQGALDRHPVDGLVQFFGRVVRHHHRVAVGLVGLADVDGPGTGLPRAHDQHGAVGVVAGHPPQGRPQGVVQEHPPHQAQPAHKQQDEHRRDAVGRVEQHAVDEQPVDKVDRHRGHGHHHRQAEQVPLAGVFP